MHDETRDERESQALFRYKIISGYLALDPPRGERGQVLKLLAAKTWTAPDGREVVFAAETLRAWVRRYRRGGLQALGDKPRPRPGVQILSDDQIKLVCDLKREVPQRSLDHIIEIVESMKLIKPGVLTRSTLHRVLEGEGISGRPKPKVSDKDLDRFEVAHPNDLWQSDMAHGPWLPDPDRPGKKRRAYLYLFVDDHSRLLLHGRYAFKGDLPALELVFRRCLQRWGAPRRVYYDNGKTYRANQMKRIIATIGIHGIIYCRPYRPMGKGKVESLINFVQNRFEAELKASPINTLDELNRAFVAWADEFYNRRVHSETGQTPYARWSSLKDSAKLVDEELLRQAFLWAEQRKADKTAIFSLFNTKYQVDADLAGKRIEVRYDPEDLELVEIWHAGVFKQRVSPYKIGVRRRPTKASSSVDDTADDDPKMPVANWLGHLVELRRERLHEAAEPAPATPAVNDDRAVNAALQAQLAVDVFDPDAIDAFLVTYGPFDASRVTETLSQLIEHDGRNDHHISYYLDVLKSSCRRGAK